MQSRKIKSFREIPRVFRNIFIYLMLNIARGIKHLMTFLYGSVEYIASLTWVDVIARNITDQDININCKKNIDFSSA